MKVNQKKVPSKISHSVTKFNPVVSTEDLLSNVPPKPTREDSLDSSRRTLPKARVEDPLSFDSRHADALTNNCGAFFRTKGSMESYLEEAHKGRDLLVWQAAHPRGFTRGNNPSNFKPANDFYDIENTGATTETHLNSQSRLMVNRHLTSRNSRGGGGRGTLHSSNSHSQASSDVLLVRNVNPNTTRIMPSPRTRVKMEANNTLRDIDRFEKKHHDRCEIEHMTKKELISMILDQGFELPGDTIWDADAQVNRKAKLKKSEYLTYARQKLFSMDSPPICQKGQKIGKKHFCIVSVHPGLRGSVRIIAYDTDRSMEYNLFLTAAKLEDLDVPKVPEDRKADSWAQWSGLFIDRLQLSPQGDLFVGPAPLMKSGLSKGFCLTGRDVKSKEEALKRKPSRVHVTRWFAEM